MGTSDTPHGYWWSYSPVMRVCLKGTDGLIHGYSGIPYFSVCISSGLFWVPKAFLMGLSAEKNLGGQRTIVFKWYIIFLKIFMSQSILVTIYICVGIAWYIYQWKYVKVVSHWIWFTLAISWYLDWMTCAKFGLIMPLVANMWVNKGKWDDRHDKTEWISLLEKWKQNVSY